MPSESDAKPALPDSLSVSTCEPCRDQHLKCDRALPTCGRCLDTNRECIRGYRFKPHRHGAFPRGQRWSKVPRRIKFVLDNGEYDELDDDGGDIEPPPIEDHRHEAIPSREPPSRSQSHNAAATLQRTDTWDSHQSAPTPSSAHGTTAPARGTRSSTQTPVTSTSLNVRDDPIRSKLYLERPIWPIQRREEALLFRHYIQNVAIWLDLCDPESHFVTSIPSRAGTCPILLNAIFALAARHLAHTSGYDSLASNRYHEQCLNYLIPLLDHAITISDENIFAATIILRVLEEMDVPNLGQDTHGHLLGIHAFVAPFPTPAHSPPRGQPSHPQRRFEPNTLHAACFWAGLRQEIYSAVINHQSVRMNLAHEGVVDRSTAPADDFVWANRAIVHCADVLNFCYGEGGSGSRDATRWEELGRANREWKAALPESYMPVFYRESSSVEAMRGNELPEGADAPIVSAFPEVWYWKGCHVIAVQHHILAELYLALYDPTHPRTGAQRRAADANLSALARTLVRNLCGIGIGNQWCPPAMFTACMGIAAAGDRFELRSDMDALLEVLRMTEREHGRPTRAVRAQLKRCWGLD